MNKSKAWLSPSLGIQSILRLLKTGNVYHHYTIIIAPSKVVLESIEKRNNHGVIPISQLPLLWLPNYFLDPSGIFILPYLIDDHVSFLFHFAFVHHFVVDGSNLSLPNFFSGTESSKFLNMESNLALPLYTLPR